MKIEIELIKILFAKVHDATSQKTEFHIVQNSYFFMAKNLERLL